MDARHIDLATSLTRRTILATASAGVLATVAAPAIAAAPTTTGPATGSTSGRSSRGALAFISAMTSAYPQFATTPRLPQSYADELGLFSTAFVYDSALAVCAALAMGRVDLARTIGDGLVFAQSHDPGFSDGRLRQGYNVGPYTFYDGNPQPYGLALPDGTANIGWQFGFLGTAVGDMAWPGIALVHLAKYTGQKRYLDAAVRIGSWILDRAVNPGSLGGFRFGVNAADQAVPNVSTEHNIDCVAFFTLLARSDRRRDWTAAATRARRLVERMWDSSRNLFLTGSNDGSTLNRSILPLDPQTWSWLALRDRRYAKALDWAAGTLAVTDTPAVAHSQLPAGLSISGVTFSDASLTSAASYNGLPVCRQGVWLEGTAQLAVALADRDARGDARAANALLAQLGKARSGLGAGQKAGGGALTERGVVAASSLLDSGFGYGYFQVQHVGATSWYVMAERGANPLRWGGLI